MDYTAAALLQQAVRQVKNLGADVVGVWRTATPMPTARLGLAVVSVGGKIYAIGGAYVQQGASYETSLTTHQMFDPATGTWTSRAALPQRLHYIGAAEVGGKIYVLGGRSGESTGGGGSYSTVRTTYQYDPGSNSWTTKSQRNTATYHYGAAAGPNGKVYSFGGYISSSDAYDVTEEFDPVSNTWTTKAAMPTKRHSMGVARAGNGRIYAVGGRSYGSAPHLNSNEEYDTGTNTWATKAPLPSPRYGMAAVPTDKGTILAIGGFVDTKPVRTCEEYDPAANKWIPRALMPTARGYLGAANVGGKIYAIGGGTDIDGGELTTNEELTLVPIERLFTAPMAYLLAGG